MGTNQGLCLFADKTFYKTTGRTWWNIAFCSLQLLDITSPLNVFDHEFFVCLIICVLLVGLPSTWSYRLSLLSGASCEVKFKRWGGRTYCITCDLFCWSYYIYTYIFRQNPNHGNKILGLEPVVVLGVGQWGTVVAAVDRFQLNKKFFLCVLKQRKACSIGRFFKHTGGSDT